MSHKLSKTKMFSVYGKNNFAKVSKNLNTSKHLNTKVIYWTVKIII